MSPLESMLQLFMFTMDALQAGLSAMEVACVKNTCKPLLKLVRPLNFKYSEDDALIEVTSHVYGLKGSLSAWQKRLNNGCA